MVVHTGNLSTQKVETGGSRSSSAIESLRTAVSRERKKEKEERRRRERERKSRRWERE